MSPFWTPDIGTSLVGRVYPAHEGVTSLAYVREDDGTQVLVSSAEWPAIPEGTLVRVTYKGESITRSNKYFYRYAVERLNESGSMNGFDAEKIAQAGEVWTIGFEPYLIVERDGRKFAVRLVGERSIASNMPARRGWPTFWPTRAAARVALCGDPFGVTRCPICRKPAHAGETDESGAHPECAAAVTRGDSSSTKRGIAFHEHLEAEGRRERPRFTLDSTVREVMGALEGVEGLKVVPAEGTWVVGGSTLGRVRPRFENFAKTIQAPWEASGLVMGQDAHGNKVVTGRLSALAPTHLEAIVALANVVAGEG